ncbi:MAG: hypothetical protein IJT15_03740 [Rickettsiales bacterium]|nr:hypothetical protein [Rickettsiales bacterium]
MQVNNDLLKEIYKNNGIELTMENADNPNELADFNILPPADICLSENQQAIYIVQEDNGKTNQIVIYLDKGKIMICKNIQKAFEKLYNKFPFNKEKIQQLTVHNNNIPDEEINKNSYNMDENNQNNYSFEEGNNSLNNSNNGIDNKENDADNNSKNKERDDFFDEIKLSNKNVNNTGQNRSSSNITENNNNKDVNEEELLKVTKELNKIYSEDNNYEIISNNGKKNEPRLKGYEQKNQNSCNYCLDCLKWCKERF